jgi:hypothetical protein
MSSLSRKWAISSTGAVALVFFASIFVFYSRSPPGVTGSRSNGAVLSNRSFGVWMTEFSGSVDYKIAPIPAKKLTQPKSVFPCHLGSTNHCHGSECFTTERLSKGR